MPEWHNEVEAVVEAKFGDVGMGILNDPDHTYEFNKKLAANPEGRDDIWEGLYELQVKFNKTDYAGQAIPLIQNKIWFRPQAACTGQSLARYKHLLDKAANC